MQCNLTLSPFSKIFFAPSRMVGCCIHFAETTKRLTLMALFKLIHFLFIYTLLTKNECTQKHKIYLKIDNLAMVNMTS